MAKFERLPPGIADALKKNATFVEDAGPMREAVLAASPPTKEELLRDSPGAVEIAKKVCCREVGGGGGGGGGCQTMASKRWPLL